MLQILAGLPHHTWRRLTLLCDMHSILPKSRGHGSSLSSSESVSGGAEHAASGRARERRQACGDHEAHQLKRDGGRRLHRSGSAGKFQPRSATTGQLFAAFFVLIGVLASAYVVVLIWAGKPGEQTSL